MLSGVLFVFLMACTGPESPDNKALLDWIPPSGFWSYEGAPRVLVAQADTSFEIGAYGVLDPHSRTWISEGGQAHSDALCGCAGPFLMLVNRLQGDNLQFVDPESGQTVLQWSTGNGSNPYNAVFYGERAFISLYEEPSLLVARWDTGQELGRVDLSAWADSDGIPEASRLFHANGLLFLTLERMDRELWRPAGESMLLAIDPERLEVTGSMVLPADNPAGGDWSLQGSLAWTAATGAYLSDSGDGLALDGGLMAVDLQKMQGRVHLSEDLLQRNLFSALVEGDTAWLSTYDVDWQNHIERWDLASLQGIEVQEGFFPGWARAGASDLWVADSERGELLLLDWESAKEYARVRTSLRPSSVAWCGP